MFGYICAEHIIQQALIIALETYLLPLQRDLTSLRVKAIDLSTRARNILECRKSFSFIISSLVGPMYERRLMMARHNTVVYVSRSSV